MADVSLKYLLLGDSRSAEGAMKKVGSEADKTHKHLVGLGKAALVGFGAAAAGMAVVFKTGFDEAKDASAGSAQLAAGIKSTGNAANVSVKGLNDLASSIQGYSGQTDDSIVKSEQLLLTFTNIRNNGPDKIFDMATKASADMAAKMGGDASASAIQLGKALNDPVKGIGALARVGVSFSDSQKATIKSMVAVGDTAGAQKIILGELTTEFGGAAKAAGDSIPGQMAKAKRSFEDVSQKVVTGLLPAFNRLMQFVTSSVIPGISRLANFVAAHWPQIQAVIVTAWTGYIRPALAALVTFVTQRVIPAVQAVVGWVVAHWPQIQAVLVAVWNTIKPVLTSFISMLKSLWNSVLKPIVAWVKTHWPQIQTVIKVVALAVAVAVKIMATSMKVTFDVIAAIIRGGATVFRWLYSNVIAPVSRTIASAVHGVSTVFSNIGDGLQSGARWVGHWLGRIQAFVQNIFNFVQRIAGRIWGPLQSGFEAVADGIRTAIGWITAGLQHLIDAVVTAKNFITGGTAFGGQFSAAYAAIRPSSGSTTYSNYTPKAAGGPVSAGMPYIVGEQRPELFVPRQSGTIIPYVPSGGGGTTIVHTYNVTINGVIDKQAAGREIQSALLALKRGTGARTLGLA